MITFSTENNHKNEGRGVRKPTKHDNVINGESLDHVVHCFGYAISKYVLGALSSNWVWLAYSELSMSFDATYYKKCLKYEPLLILLIDMSRLFLMKRSEFELSRLKKPKKTLQQTKNNKGCMILCFNSCAIFGQLSWGFCDTGDMENDHHNRYLSAVNYKIWDIS